MSKLGITLVSMWKIVIYSNCVVSTALHETGNWKGDSWFGIVLELQNGPKAFHLACYVILQIIKSVFENCYMGSGTSVFVPESFPGSRFEKLLVSGEGGGSDIPTQILGDCTLCF